MTTRANRLRILAKRLEDVVDYLDQTINHDTDTRFPLMTEWLTLASHAYALADYLDQGWLNDMGQLEAQHTITRIVSALGTDTAAPIYSELLKRA